jgi:multidrug efflux pump subunit AcrB
MNSARFALEHKHTIFALLLAVLFLGVFSRFTIKTELFPDTSPPLVNVITPYPGAGAATVPCPFPCWPPLPACAFSAST